jgi:hypothetical protein
MKMNKQQWIEEVLASTEGMSRAEPSIDFYEQVKNKLGRPSTGKVIQLPLKQLAAAAIILLALNIGSIVHFIGHNTKSGNNISGNPLLSEMQVESTYNY